MFNIKTIGIAFSVLALVGLVGALMAGPAFAGRPDRGSGAVDISHRTNICHYNAMVLDDPLTLEVDEAEAEEWQDKVVDDDSLAKHLGDDKYKGHSDELDPSNSDFEISFEGEGEFAGQPDMNDSREDCTRLQGAL